jgi:hypothetical protein
MVFLCAVSLWSPALVAFSFQFEVPNTVCPNLSLEFEWIDYFLNPTLSLSLARHSTIRVPVFPRTLLM